MHLLCWLRHPTAVTTPRCTSCGTQRLVEQGCYDCLREAFLAAALLVLREKELELTASEWMDAVTRLAGPVLESPFRRSRILSRPTRRGDGVHESQLDEERPAAAEHRARRVPAGAHHCGDARQSDERQGRDGRSADTLRQRARHSCERTRRAAWPHDCAHVLGSLRRSHRDSHTIVGARHVVSRRRTTWISSPAASAQTTASRPGISDSSPAIVARGPNRFASS